MTSDSSVMTFSRGFGLGCTNGVAFASASLMTLKAVVAGEVHCSAWLFVPQIIQGYQDSSTLGNEPVVEVHQVQQFRQLT